MPFGCDRGGVIADCAIVENGSDHYDAAMASTPASISRPILAIDIGATNIKSCRVDRHGALLERVRRRRTPYPCTPDQLVRTLSARITSSDCGEVGVSFPGEFADGHVVHPGNLSRPGGITTDVDPALEREWSGFAFQSALCDSTGRDVKVANDAALAALAALGSCRGVGVELVVTLGTGFGLALCVDGTLQRVRDVGAEPFRGGRTYDEILGERFRLANELEWRAVLEQAILNFVNEFGALTVHLAGGNARRLSPRMFEDVPSEIVIDGNEALLVGAARLFST